MAQFGNHKIEHSEQQALKYKRIDYYGGHIENHTYTRIDEYGKEDTLGILKIIDTGPMWKFKAMYNLVGHRDEVFQKLRYKHKTNYFVNFGTDTMISESLFQNNISELVRDNRLRDALFQKALYSKGARDFALKHMIGYNVSLGRSISDNSWQRTSDFSSQDQIAEIRQYRLVIQEQVERVIANLNKKTMHGL